jgi:hypothetical protein
LFPLRKGENDINRKLLFLTPLFLFVIACSCFPGYVITLNLPVRDPTPTPFQPMFMIGEQPTPTPSIPAFGELVYQDPSFAMEIYDSNGKEAYSTYWRNLEILGCDDCDPDKVMSLLGSAQRERWAAAWESYEDAEILYIHSSRQPWGYHLGEILVLMDRDGALKDTKLCFDETCYLVTGIYHLQRSDVRSVILVEELFEKQYDDQIIIQTCSDLVYPGLQTPKLYIQLVPH